MPSKHVSPKGVWSPDKLVRTALQRYWRYSRGLTLGAQGIVRDERGHVLLVRHTYRPGWHFPGGGVEKGETAEDALRRELREEAGVEIAARPELFGLYSNHTLFPGDHIALFVVTAWRQIDIAPSDREIAERGLFAPDALPAETVAPVRERLAELAGTQSRSPHWSAR